MVTERDLGQKKSMAAVPSLTQKGYGARFGPEKELCHRGWVGQAPDSAPARCGVPASERQRAISSLDYRRQSESNHVFSTGFRTLTNLCQALPRGGRSLQTRKTAWAGFAAGKNETSVYVLGLSRSYIPEILPLRHHSAPGHGHVTDTT